jgi:MATE family multidrug resistance protein
LISIVFFLFALPIAKLYTTDAEVYTIAISLIHLAAFIQLFTGANIIFGGGLRGVGDTTFLSRTAMLFNWVLFIPLTIVLTQVYDLGQVGAWAALIFLIILVAVANSWRYLSLNWSSIKVKSGKTAPVSAAGHM